MSKDNAKKKYRPMLWSKSQTELIPHRIRAVIRVLMPLWYFFMILFGIGTILSPIKAFNLIIGDDYSYVWAALVSTFATLSLIGLILKTRTELYSSIVLTILLFIYPVYEIIDDSIDGRVDNWGSFFGAAIYILVPFWRVIDILLDIRKSQRRRLYANSLKGNE